MQKGMETSEAPVALDHLARQTGGDASLAREVLEMFLTRVAADLERVKAAGPGEARRQAAHLIVGSARAIGAGEVARLAAAVEAEAGEATSAIAALETAIAVARRFVGDYLAR